MCIIASKCMLMLSLVEFKTTLFESAYEASAQATAEDSYRVDKEDRCAYRHCCYLLLQLRVTW